MTYEKLVDSILTAKDEMLKHKIEANSVTLNGRKYGKLIENCPPNMKPTIFGMTVKADYALPDNYEFLVQYEPPQPQTNSNRIRAMTDEELAEFLQKNRGGCRALTTESYVCDFYTDDLNTDCKKCWLDWLKQEVE